jgi:hypothetical protein
MTVTLVPSLPCKFLVTIALGQVCEPDLLILQSLRYRSLVRSSADRRAPLHQGTLLPHWWKGRADHFGLGTFLHFG